MFAFTYSVDEEDYPLFPQWILNLQDLYQFTDEEFEDLAVNRASQQRIPAFPKTGYCCDDIDLLAQLLVSCSVPQTSAAPSLLVKVGMYQPTFVNIYNPFSTVINFEHFLGIPTSHDFIPLDITLEGYPSDCFVR